jgi:hypothetical protein
MKPLSKKTRLKLIVLSLFVFLILVPMVLASSFGYRISSLGDVLTLIKTGGIYIHSDINNTEIYINDKYYKQSGRILRNTLISDLSPNKTYKVVIQKEGYNDWRKELLVYPSLVTESAILMLPSEIETEQIFPYEDDDGNGTTTAPVANDVVSDDPKGLYTEEYFMADIMFFDEKRLAEFDIDELGDDLINRLIDSGLEIDLIDSESESALDTESELGLDLADEDSLNATSTEEEKPDYFEVLGLEVESLDDLENLREKNEQIAWLEDGNVIVGWRDLNKTQHYYYCLFSEFGPDDEGYGETECRTKITVDWEDQIKYFEFLPGRDDVLVVLTYSGVYAVEIDDRSERNIQPIYVGEGLQFRISDDLGFVVKDGKDLYRIDL